MSSAKEPKDAPNDILRMEIGMASQVIFVAGRENSPFCESCKLLCSLQELSNALGPARLLPILATLRVLPN